MFFSLCFVISAIMLKSEKIEVSQKSYCWYHLPLIVEAKPAFVIESLSLVYVDFYFPDPLATMSSKRKSLVEILFFLHLPQVSSCYS